MNKLTSSRQVLYLINYTAVDGDQAGLNTGLYASSANALYSRGDPSIKPQFPSGHIHLLVEVEAGVTA